MDADRDCLVELIETEDEPPNKEEERGGDMEFIQDMVAHTNWGSNHTHYRSSKSISEAGVSHLP